MISDRGENPLNSQITRYFVKSYFEWVEQLGAVMGFVCETTLEDFLSF